MVSVVIKMTDMNDKKGAAPPLNPPAAPSSPSTAALSSRRATRPAALALGADSRLRPQKMALFDKTKS